MSGQPLSSSGDRKPEPSLLKVLLQNRHLQTHAAFTAEYEKAARRIDRALIGSAPGREQLQRWLSGRVKTMPRPHHCRVLERMFPGHTAAELLAPYSPQSRKDGQGAPLRLAEPGSSGNGDHDGRQSTSNELLASAVWQGPDQLEAVLDKGSAGSGRLDYLESEAERLGARVVKVTPSLLLEETLLHLRSVRELLSERQPTPAQQRLARIGARLAIVVGEIMFNDNHFALARRWYVAARRAAGEAGDRELSDIALAGLTYLTTYSGDPRGVLALVGPRLESCPAPSPAVAWLWAFRAKAYAALAERAQFERSIESARAVLDACRPERIRPGVFSFLPQKLDFYAAHGLVDLGDTEGALAATASALSRYDPTDTQEPALVRLEQASALAQNHEIAEACRIALDALTEPVTYHSAAVVIRARQFDALLGPTTRDNREWREYLADLRLPDPFVIA